MIPLLAALFVGSVGLLVLVTGERRLGLLPLLVAGAVGLAALASPLSEIADLAGVSTGVPLFSAGSKVAVALLIGLSVLVLPAALRSATREGRAVVATAVLVGIALTVSAVASGDVGLVNVSIIPAGVVAGFLVGHTLGWERGVQLVAALLVGVCLVSVLVGVAGIDGATALSRRMAWTWPFGGDLSSQRLTGVTAAPNLLGLLTVISALLSYVVRAPRLLRIGGVAISLLAALGAESRTALIGLGVVATVVVIERLRARRPHAARPALVGLLVAVAAMPLLAVVGDPTTDEDFFAERVIEDADAASYGGRGRIWDASFDAIAERPVLGWGTGVFWRGDFRAERSPARIDFPQAHHLGIQILGQGGVVALAMLVALGVAVARLLAATDDPRHRLVLAGSFAALLLEAGFEAIYTGDGLRPTILILVVFGLSARCVGRTAGVPDAAVGGVRVPVPGPPPARGGATATAR